MRSKRVCGSGIHHGAVVVMLAVASVGVGFGASVAVGQTLPDSSPTSASTTGPAGSIDASTPKGTLKSLATAMAAGDANGIRSLIDAATPAEQKVIGATSRIASAMAGLNRAMRDRFGQAAVTPVLGDSAEQLQQSVRNIDASVEKIDGDHAAVRLAPGMSQGSMFLRRVDGQWKVQLPEQAKLMTDAQADENVSMLSTQAAAIQTTTAEVQAGKYPTAAEAATALRSKNAAAQAPPAPGTGVPASQPAPGL